MRLALWTIGSLLLGWTIVQMLTELWLWGMTGRYLRILSLGEVLQLLIPNSMGLNAILGGIPTSPISLVLGSAMMWAGRQDKVTTE